MNDDNPYRSPQLDERAGRPERQHERLDLVRIASFQYITEADLATTLLAAEGFDAVLDDVGVVSVDPLLSTAVGGVKLLVPKAEAEQAAAFLESHRESLVRRQNDADVEFDCEECDKPLKFPGKSRGRVETCPECGSFIDVPD